jgi:hypothetical protein
VSGFRCQAKHINKRRTYEYIAILRLCGFAALREIAHCVEVPQTVKLV